MPSVDIKITGLEELKNLSQLGKRILEKNKAVFTDAERKTRQTVVSNVPVALEKGGSLLASVDGKVFPDGTGFHVGIGGKNRNTRSGKPTSTYAIPQDLGFQHYRNGFIRGYQYSRIAVDQHMSEIVTNINNVVHQSIVEALGGGTKV